MEPHGGLELPNISLSPWDWAPPSHAARLSSSVQNSKAERDLGQEISGYSKLLHKMLGQAFGCSLWLVLQDTGIAKATPAQIRRDLRSSPSGLHIFPLDPTLRSRNCSLVGEVQKQ